MIRFTAAVLGLNNWQAACYLVEEFSLPVSLSGSRDNQEQIRERERERRKQLEKEQRFKDAWLQEVNRLKYLEVVWNFALDHQLFTPLSDHHFPGSPLTDARKNRSEAVTIATKEQMKTEFSYFGEAWNFFKKFYETSEADEYWDAVVQEAGAIVQKYDCPLCKAVVLAIIDELERKHRAGRKDEAV